MKKVASILFMALFLTPCLLSAESRNPYSETEFEAKLIKVKTFKGKLTLSGGCNVEYSITIDYDILPPRINSVHGTVTLSGNCTGTQTFRMSAATDDKGKVLSVNSDVKLDGLRIDEFNAAFTKELNDLNLFQQ